MAYVLVRLVQKFERLESRDDYEAQFLKIEIAGRPGRNVKIALFESEQSSS
jgi:hypothetical protein